MLDLRARVYARFKGDEEATSDLNVYARRPIPENAEPLSRHIQAYGLDEQIAAAAHAVLRSAGPTTFGPKSRSVTASSMTQNIRGHGTGIITGTNVQYIYILSRRVNVLLAVAILAAPTVLFVRDILPWRSQADADASSSHTATTDTPRSTGCFGEAQVFGLRGGRLTYTRIKAATNHEMSRMLTQKDFSFRPSGLAALSSKNLLVVSEDGRLFRVDVQLDIPKSRITTGPPVDLGAWDQGNLLTFDGKGSLFAIKGDQLMQYKLTAHNISTMPDGKAVGDGFAHIESLAAAAPNYVLGLREGSLLGYQVGDLALEPKELGFTWDRIAHLVTPGPGLFYGRAKDRSLNTYRYLRPLMGENEPSGVRNRGIVAKEGWIQNALSAVPNTVTCG